MTGAGFVLAINVSVAAIFCLAFVLIALTNRSDRVAPWFAGAYGFGIAYIVSEFLVPIQPTPQFAYMFGFLAFLGSMTAVTIGVSRRYRRPTPVAAIVIIAGLSVIANWFAYDLERHVLLRLLAYQVPYAALQALAAWIILRSPRHEIIDLSLLAAFAVSAVQFLSKPFAALMLGGPGATPQDYIASNYAMFSQSLGAILQVGVGVLILMLLVRDMLVEVTARSETDVLSGLLNRRGFEDRAPALLAAARPNYPTAMILADLDAFKSINDEYGHDAGDGVIHAFSRLADAEAPATACVARLGGEEFAILLPGTSASSAHMFANALRERFANLVIDALPKGRFCTVSMGVAETRGEETLPDLRRRADTALYAAKRAGRDRVCVEPAAMAATDDISPDSRCA
ncbi:diguanylate cyclase [Devosia sp.]|uniref:GGDEF domain-containing protein n=1 Tax=Devosia sp. TaxID=1871048 RepID=UPI003A9049FB